MSADLTHAERHAVGAVDIGGTKIAVAAIGADGRVLARESIANVTGQGAALGFEAAMTEVVGMLERVSAAARVTLTGIGIACTGPVDPSTGEVGQVEFLPGWEGHNPVRWLGERFGVDVAMENDADAAALAEWHWGAGRGKSTVVCVTVGTGIGGGMILDGRLYRGVDGAHPELGHHVIDPSGPECFCGFRGCWEVLAAGPAIARRFEREFGRDGEAKSLVAHSGALTAKAICELARTGDVIARRVVSEEGRYLGLGIANLINLFMPQIIVLSGSVMASADLWMPMIRDVIGQGCRLVPATRVALALSAFDHEASLIGAGALMVLRRSGSTC